MSISFAVKSTTEKHITSIDDPSQTVMCVATDNIICVKSEIICAHV